MLEGRCLPYGNGITYWPLVEVVRDLDLELVLGGEPDGATAHEPDPRGGRSRRAALPQRRALLGDPPPARDARARAAARARPRRHPVGGAGLPRPRRVPRRLEPRRADPRLLPCTARPAEVRPGWAGTTIQLVPAPARARAHGCSRTSPGRSIRRPPRRVGRATGGNPLFLEEMLRMLVEDGVLVERDGRLEPLAAVDVAARTGDGPGRARGAPRPARARTSWPCCSGPP